MRTRLRALPRLGLALLLSLWLAIAPALAGGGAGSSGGGAPAAPPLRKVPGPSPAATLDQFQALTARAEARIRQAVRRGLAEPGPFFSREVHREVDAATSELRQATQALDLSRVPVALRPMTGVGTMLMLRSLLNYDLQQNPGLAVPDAEQVRRERLTSWTIPETPITLTALTASQVQAGQACRQCSQGDFLFSSDTLVQVPADFAQVFGGRYRLQRQYGADLFTYWAMIPGGALPPKLFLRLPVSLRRLLLFPVAGQSLLQWLLLLPGTLLVLLAMAWWIARLRRWHRQRGEPQGLLPHLLGLLAVLPLLGLVWAWQGFAIGWINLIGAREAAVLVIGRLALGALQAVLVYLLAESGGQLISLRRQRDAADGPALARRKGAGQILTIARLAGVLGAGAVLIRTGQDLGLTSLTLLGLASVPALAISLGTQQLIRDIADGFSLLLDGQLRPGDRCTIGTAKSGAIQGQITSLGMRSLRILQEDGSILSIPNSQVADAVVTNHRFASHRPLNLALPLGEDGLGQAQERLEQARLLLADCPALGEARAELEATDQGWNLRLKGRWRPDLSQADQRAALESLHLRLIELTNP